MIVTGSYQGMGLPQDVVGPPPTKYICKHCKVQVYGKGDSKPILGREHKKSCPRRRNAA